MALWGGGVQLSHRMAVDTSIGTVVGVIALGWLLFAVFLALALR